MNNLYKNCDYLTNTFSNRWIGSPGETQAANWAQGLFEKMGYSVERPTIDCPTWDYESTELIVDGEKITSDAQMFSPGCNATGELIAVVPNPDTSIPVDVKGKITIIKEADTLHTTHYASGVLFRNALLDSLQAAGALATIIISTIKETYATKIFRNPDSTQPCAGICDNDGQRLLEKVGCQASLKIVAKQRPGKTSYIAVEVGPADKPVHLAVAHFDASSSCPGAVDNASGLTTVLSLADYFSKNPPKNCRMRFMLFGGHEYGGLDMLGYTSKFYAENNPEKLLDIKSVMHLDIVGLKGTTPCVRVKDRGDLRLTVSKALTGYEKVTQEPYNGFVGADFGAFMRHGIDCIIIEASRSEYNVAAYHSPIDDMRWMGEQELKDTYETSLAILKQLDLVEVTATVG